MLKKVSKINEYFTTKMKDHNLCVSKADKGNSVVIMDRQYYVQKVNNFILSNKGTKITFNFTSCKNKIRDSIEKMNM